MKNKLHFFTGLCLAVTLSAPSASAQMGTTLGVTIPQKFTVSGRELPAGDYRIQELSSGGSTVLLFRSGSGSASVLAEPITKHMVASGSSVTLHQVGSHLQLDEVWLAGCEVGYQILSSGK